MKAGALMAWIVAGSTACGHFHRDDGAPGHVDLSHPPAFPELRSLEPARPPGEAMLVVTPAVSVLAGRHAGARANLVGAELSVEWGREPESAPTMHGHEGDQRLLPRHGWGLTLGAQVATAASWRNPSAGPITIEVRRSFAGILFGGAGWISDPRTGRHGAIATAVANPFILRAGYIPGDGAFWSVGLSLLFPVAWVWTR